MAPRSVQSIDPFPSNKANSSPGSPREPSPNPAPTVTPVPTPDHTPVDTPISAASIPTPLQKNAPRRRSPRLLAGRLPSNGPPSRPQDLPNANAEPAGDRIANSLLGFGTHHGSSTDRPPPDLRQNGHKRKRSDDVVDPDGDEGEPAAKGDSLSDAIDELYAEAKKDKEDKKRARQRRKKDDEHRES